MNASDFSLGGLPGQDTAAPAAGYQTLFCHSCQREFNTAANENLVYCPSCKANGGWEEMLVMVAESPAPEQQETIPEEHALECRKADLARVVSAFSDCEKSPKLQLADHETITLINVLTTVLGQMNEALPNDEPTMAVKRRIEIERIDDLLFRLEMERSRFEGIAAYRHAKMELAALDGKVGQ